MLMLVGLCTYLLPLGDNKATAWPYLFIKYLSSDHNNKKVLNIKMLKYLKLRCLKVPGKHLKCILRFLDSTIDLFQVH